MLLPPIVAQETPPTEDTLPPAAATSILQAPVDAFDNPLSEKDEARDLISDWELSQSVAVDMALLQVPPLATVGI